jgi:hypothetical protein
MVGLRAIEFVRISGHIGGSQSASECHQRPFRVGISRALVDSDELRSTQAFHAIDKDWKVKSQDRRVVGGSHEILGSASQRQHLPPISRVITSQ